MSPAQAKSNVAYAPTLAPANVRAALDALRVAENSDALKRAISSLMSSLSLHSNLDSSNSQREGSTQTLTVRDASTLDYVVTRLTNGASVSTRFIRANFTLALYTLLQSHPQRSVAVSRILGIYTASPESSDIPSVREHVLGALASATAMVAAVGSQLSLDEARDIIKIIRVALNPEHTQWRLAPAATTVVLRLLHVQPANARSQLVKPLWAICSARPHAEHSLTLALALLLDFSLVSPAAVHTLYPTLDSPLSDALMSPYQTGFSLFDSPLIPDISDYGNASAAAVPTVRSVVPHAWRLVLRYVGNGPTVSLMKEDVCSFWQRLVRGHLLASQNLSSKVTKPLVAVQLLPHVFRSLTKASDVSHILDENFAKTLLNIISATKTNAQASRRSRSSPSSKKILLCVAQVFRRISSDFARNAKNSNEGTACDFETVEVAFWKAIIHNGLAPAFGAPTDLAKSIAVISPAATKAILSEGINTFAKPQKTSQEFSSTVTEIKRNQTLSFLLTLSRALPLVTNDVIRISTLFAMFKPLSQKESARSDKSSKLTINFDIFEPNESDFAGILPCPSPAFSNASSNATFNRLMAFLTEKRSNSSYLKVCVDTFLSASSATDALEAKYKQNISVKPIQTRLIQIVDFSSETVESIEDVSICNALKVLALHVACELLALRTSHFKNNGAAEDGTTETLKEVENIANSIITCHDFVIGQKTDADDDDLVVENIERITHLICVYMGREGAKPFVGLQALGCLSDIVDDRVIAVLFDVMDTYREGVEDLGVTVGVSNDQNVDVESSVLGESESDVDNDGSDVENFEQGEHGDDDMDVSKIEENVTGEESNEDEEDEAESTVDSDINIEEENEESLKALDNHLSQHLRLIKEQRKSNRQRPLAAKRSILRVSNVFKLIESVVRSLRIRLECNKEGREGSRTVLIFSDILVRMIEFALSNETDNLAFFQKITDIFTKQMREVSPALLARHLSDLQSMSEITDRLFQAVVNCKKSQALDGASVELLSAALHLLISVSILASESVSYADFTAKYEELLNLMLQEGKHISCSGMFSSFIKRGGDESLNLITKATERLKDGSMSKASRTEIAKMVELMAITIERKDHQVDMSKERIDLFWLSVERVVHSNLCQNSLQLWDPSGVKHLLRAVCVGLGERSGADSTTSAATQFNSSEELKSKSVKIMRTLKLVPKKDSKSLAGLFKSSATKREVGKRSQNSGKENVRKKQKISKMEVE